MAHSLREQIIAALARRSKTVWVTEEGLWTELEQVLVEAEHTGLRDDERAALAGFFEAWLAHHMSETRHMGTLADLLHAQEGGTRQA